MSQAGPIAVYGATGYTGKLVAHELARRELDFVLSGRSAGKLRALASDLGGDPPVRPASLDDRDALRHVFGECAAVINCAGPFTSSGSAVIRSIALSKAASSSAGSASGRLWRPWKDSAREPSGRAR